MKQVPIPDFICPSCREYDWNWNEAKWRWECRVCAIYGTPEPDPPEFDGVVDGDEWIDQTLRAYDIAFRELEEAKAAPNVGQAESILWLARTKKAERKLGIASIQADVASQIMELKKVNTQGDVYLDLPDVDLKIRIKW